MDYINLLDEFQYKLGYKRTFKLKRDFRKALYERTAIVTGGTRGMGLSVVRELVAQGCFVFVASSQTKDKFPLIMDKIYNGIPEVDSETKLNRGRVELYHLDLSSMESVKKFARHFLQTYSNLNYLICNAGIMFAPKSISKDNFEMHLAVNYLGHCLLTMEFLPLLIEAAKKSKIKSRIVNVSSSTHRATTFDFDNLRKDRYYSASQAYAQSKLAQIMFSSKLSRALESCDCEEYVQVFCLHPGVVVSDLYEHVLVIKMFPTLAKLIKLVTRNIVEGAETTLYTLLSPDLNDYTDKYLEDCAFKEPSNASKNITNQERLWHLTHQLLRKWIPIEYANLMKID